ncbi:MAG: HDIG domain-containing protein [Pirellula sp.]|nr:HDIG domain-containing protein [Pirellula sp.]
MSSTTGNVKNRSERAANLKIDKYSWRQSFARITEWESLGRFAIAMSVGIVILLFLRAWEPPFTFQQGLLPQRAILARVPFMVEDENKTEVLRLQAAREVFCVYQNRNEAISQLEGACKEALMSLHDLTDLSALTTAQTILLESFTLSPLDPNAPKISYQEAIETIQTCLGNDAGNSKYDSAMREVFSPYLEIGLIKALTHDLEMGNQRFIRVIQAGASEEKFVDVDVQRVRISEVIVTLRDSLTRKFENLYETKDSRLLARMVHNFLAGKLPETLTLREDLSAKARQEAIAATKPAMITYDPTFGAVVAKGKVLGPKEIELLRAEHEAFTKSLTLKHKVQRFAAFAGLITALYLLCGFTIYQSQDRRLITDLKQFLRLIGLCVGCIVLAVLTVKDPLRADIAPVTIAAIVATLAFGRPTALLIMSAVCLVVIFGTRVDLSSFVKLAAASAGAILLCGRIRNRTRLMYVGCGVAAIVFTTIIGVGIMTGQALGGTPEGSAVGLVQSISDVVLPTRLLSEAGWQALLVLACGPLLVGLLPIFEWLFDIQTDLSLLELSDMSHPLLRQLAQRAPGTYNHSISVAALAESAAEVIGANGLLVRVGACFHDIGKMFKPNYFVENQTAGNNRHDTLQPAMSTLIIIAHVKDGADLGRQHRLPQRVIDFIEQHHGTTLVEYFYRLANKKCEEDPSLDEAPETAFRYPGPKPQTREAAILMIADAVESASRALVEPTPARLEGLVEKIAMKKLLDGQFEECALTLKELEKIKRSLVKSLTAIYHGRIKYPERQSAS